MWDRKQTSYLLTYKELQVLSELCGIESKHIYEASEKLEEFCLNYVGYKEVIVFYNCKTVIRFV